MTVQRWSKRDVSYPSFQYEAWLDTETGNKLVLEHEDNPWLDEPQYFARVVNDDDSIKRTVLGKADTLEEAARATREFRRERMGLGQPDS